MTKVYWIGYGGTSQLAEQFRPFIEQQGMTLTTIHEWENADVKWERTTWLNELRNADIIILPTNHEEQPAKSNNRLTQCLALGKPVICSPLDSYVRILEKYPNSFIIAKNQEEWEEALRCFTRETLRLEYSTKALEVSKEFSLEIIGKKWIDTFSNLEKVDIVIPTYNNLEGLQLCLESIRKCTRVLYNLIIVNNGTDENIHNYLQQQGDIVYVKKENLNFAKAINLGIQSGSSKHVCILNDDTIVSENWLKSMVEACQNGVGVVGPLSNCDRGWLHDFDLNIGGVELLPGTNLVPQITPIINQIYKYQTNRNDIIERDWIAFYCTLIPREIINKVGLLDEKFTNSGEDVDYCYRIKRMGYKILQTYKSFVFHFGAVSRKILANEDTKSYQESDQKTQAYLKEKWDQENVVIYTGPSWEKWDFRNVDKGGIGGSETWAVCLARELSKADYRVKLFCDCPESGIQDSNVEYIHYSEYPNYINFNWIDYFITSRTTDPLKFPIRCKKTYVMIHDIWLLSPKEQLFLDKVDKFCTLSEWHKEFVMNHHKIPEEKMLITSNGIDFSRFDQEVERIPNRLIYSSSPDRGLDTLLYLFDFIKKEIPDLELHIFYGFENYEKAVLNRNDEQEIKRVKELKRTMRKEGVFYHGRIGQQQLAREFLKSSLWAYPTDFEETFCISAIEAQCAGLPILTTNYAGLKTTVGNSGILLGNGQKGQSFTKIYREEFVENCIRLLKDEDFKNNWMAKGFENTKKYSWKKIAENWQKEFIK